MLNSHVFIYCCSDELREWFVKQECDLFKYRFEQEPMEEKRNFLEYLNLNWKIVSVCFIFYI